MIYRGPGILGVEWFSSTPAPFRHPPVSKMSIFPSHPVCVTGRAYWRESRRRSQTIRRRESLVLWKSFNTLCSGLTSSPWLRALWKNHSGKMRTSSSTVSRTSPVSSGAADVLFKGTRQRETFSHFFHNQFLLKLSVEIPTFGFEFPELVSFMKRWSTPRIIRQRLQDFKKNI